MRRANRRGVELCVRTSIRAVRGANYSETRLNAQLGAATAYAMSFCSCARARRAGAVSEMHRAS
eukprot:9838436-Lingulodinium_polyedra.AAC.1